MPLLTIEVDDKARRILTEARERWGAEHEAGMAMEESAEAIAALNHLTRGRQGADTEYVGELADSIVCNLQVIENYDLWAELAAALRYSLVKLESKLLANDKNHKGTL